MYLGFRNESRNVDIDVICTYPDQRGSFRALNPPAENNKNINNLGQTLENGGVASSCALGACTTIQSVCGGAPTEFDIPDILFYLA